MFEGGQAKKDIHVKDTQFASEVELSGKETSKSENQDLAKSLEKEEVRATAILPEGREVVTVSYEDVSSLSIGEKEEIPIGKDPKFKALALQFADPNDLKIEGKLGFLESPSLEEQELEERDLAFESKSLENHNLLVPESPQKMEESELEPKIHDHLIPTGNQRDQNSSQVSNETLIPHSPLQHLKSVYHASEKKEQIVPQDPFSQKSNFSSPLDKN